MNLMLAIHWKRQNNPEWLPRPEPLMPPRLQTMPMELILAIADCLDIVSRYCLRLTSRRLRRCLPVDFDAFDKCERWLLTTRLETDYKRMLRNRKLACTFCKRKRPWRDFGAEKPIIGPRMFLRLHKCRMLSRILSSYTWLHRLNCYGIKDTDGRRIFNEDTWGRICYRHDSLFYPQIVDFRDDRYIPHIYPKPLEVARYSALRTQMCFHCGNILTHKDSRGTECHKCMCEVYPRAVVTIYLRAGDGTKPHIKVEQVLFPPLSSSDVGIRYLENGSQYVDPSVTILLTMVQERILSPFTWPDVTMAAYTFSTCILRSHLNVILIQS